MSSSTVAELVPASDEMEFDPESPFAETIRNLKREREEVQHGKHSTLTPTSSIHVMFSRSLFRHLLLFALSVSVQQIMRFFFVFVFYFLKSSRSFFSIFFSFCPRKLKIFKKTHTPSPHPLSHHNISTHTYTRIHIQQHSPRFPSSPSFQHSFLQVRTRLSSTVLPNMTSSARNV